MYSAMKEDHFPLMLIVILLILACSLMMPVFLYAILEMKLHQSLVPMVTMIFILFCVLHLDMNTNTEIIQYMLLGFILLLLIQEYLFIFKSFTRFRELFEGEIMSISWNLNIIFAMNTIMSLYNLIAISILMSVYASEAQYSILIVTSLMVFLSPYYLLLSFYKSKCLLTIMFGMIILRLLLLITMFINIELMMSVNEFAYNILIFSLTTTIVLSMILSMTLQETNPQKRYQFSIKRRGVSIFKYKNWSPNTFRK
jgi:hypothetical protein